MMNRLKCNAVNCASNKDNCCCQPAIKVQGKSAVTTGETRCQSFIEKGEAEISNSTCFCEPNCECTVKCTACHCVHNKDGDCDADCVSINGDSAHDKSGTCCHSFEAK